MQCLRTAARASRPVLGAQRSSTAQGTGAAVRLRAFRRPRRAWIFRLALHASGAIGPGVVMIHSGLVANAYSGRSAGVGGTTGCLDVAVGGGGLTCEASAQSERWPEPCLSCRLPPPHRPGRLPRVL